MQRVLTFIALALASNVCLAEVSDKMPTQTNIWIIAFIGFMILFFLVKVSRWFLVLGLGLTIFFVFLTFNELNDPYVGSAILKEQGTQYAVTAYIASAFFLIGSLFGLWVWKENDN